jgi:hypothetical protein
MHNICFANLQKLWGVSKDNVIRRECRSEWVQVPLGVWTVCECRIDWMMTWWVSKCSRSEWVNAAGVSEWLSAGVSEESAEVWVHACDYNWGYTSCIEISLVNSYAHSMANHATSCAITFWNPRLIDKTLIGYRVGIHFHSRTFKQVQSVPSMEVQPDCFRCKKHQLHYGRTHSERSCV